MSMARVITTIVISSSYYIPRYSTWGFNGDTTPGPDGLCLSWGWGRSMPASIRADIGITKPVLEFRRLTGYWGPVVMVMAMRLRGYYGYGYGGYGYGGHGGHGGNDWMMLGSRWP